MSELEAVQERLAYDTPFWAGGMIRTADGSWRKPSPQSKFHGCAKILTKERQLEPLYARPWQLRLDAALEGQRAAGMPMRAIVLKARQMGFSTWVAMKFLQRLTQLPFQSAVVIAQDVKTAGKLFEMVKRGYAYLPGREDLGLGFSIKPDIIAQSFAPTGRKFMSFGKRGRDDGSEGLYEVDTAQNPEAGRGSTYSLMHCSEVAHWPDNGKLLGLLNSVPKIIESIVVLESTANSFNHFHKRWIRAVEGVEDPEVGSLYSPIFAAWHEDPEYQQQFFDANARLRFIDSIGTGVYGSEEPDLIDLYHCSPEQLYWRRVTIRDECDDSVERFHQEYPASPEEAFIGSGSSVFSGILVTRAIQQADKAPEPVRGDLYCPEDQWEEHRRRGGTILLPKVALWRPAGESRRKDLIEVWEHPVNHATEVGREQRRPDGQYIVSVDVAQGSVNTFEEGDFHSIQVIDHVSKLQVAQYESRIDIHDLGILCYMIGLYYNLAWLVVEVTGPGIAPTQWLQKDAHYKRMFRRRRIDRATDTVEDKIGWSTDRVTKPVIETTMSQALSEGTHGIRSPRLARQLSTYVEDDKGKHGAMEGTYDDLLMAYMIGQRVADVLRPKNPNAASAKPRTVVDDLTGY